MDNDKIREIKPTDETLNKNIIEWINQHASDIEQILVIVTWKNSETFNSRSSMNNMEKLWFMEKLKSVILVGR